MYINNLITSNIIKNFDTLIPDITIFTEIKGKLFF